MEWKDPSTVDTSSHVYDRYRLAKAESAVIEAAKAFIKHTGDPKLYVVKWHELEATVEALLAAEEEVE